MGMTPAEFNKQYPNYYKKGRNGNKYKAQKALLDGHNFDSISEGNLYAELKLQQRAGIIKSFDIQVKEEMYAYGKFICNYYVDFLIFHLDGTKEFTEHKGIPTETWRLKWKMLLAKYHDQILRGEVKCSIDWCKPKYKLKLK